MNPMRPPAAIFLIRTAKNDPFVSPVSRFPSDLGLHLSGEPRPSPPPRGALGDSGREKSGDGPALSVREHANPTIWSQIPLSLPSLLCRRLTRVNSTNIQYEGLRIRGVGRRMNSKVNQSNKVCIKSKCEVNFGLFSICPSPFSPGPYIYVARSQGSGGIRHRLQYRYTIWTRISTSIIIGPSLLGLRGTQLTGSIIYTLISSPRDSIRIADSGWISDLQIFDLIFKYLSLYCFARGFDKQAWQLWRIKRPVTLLEKQL
jgi:hypothetical protein